MSSSQPHPPIRRRSTRSYTTAAEAGGEALWQLGASDLARLLERRSVSPIEVTQGLVDRIEALEPAVRSFSAFDAESALVAARRVDRGGAGNLGLAGLPFGVKDVFDVAGLPTAAGSRVLGRAEANADADAVAALRAGGLTLLGKLSTNELGAGDFPGEPPINPWRSDVTTGVSSAGAAAALASGQLPLALGADTGGSARIPAAFCGVVGLRPTPGRISVAGVVPLSPQFDQPGPMARSVEDVALMVLALAGQPPHRLAEVDPMRVTVGVPTQHELADVDGEIADVFATVISVFSDLGFRVRELKLPPLRAVDASYRVLAYTAFHRHYGPQLQGRWHELSTPLVRRLAVAASMDERDQIAALDTAASARWTMERVFAAADVILTPATPSLPGPVGVAVADANPALITRLASVTGVPAVTFPCAVARAGVPVGAQLMGRPWQEWALLQVARVFERESPWAAKVPIELPRLVDAPEPAPVAPGAAPDRLGMRSVAAHLEVAGVQPIHELVAAAANEVELIRRELSRHQPRSRP